MGELERGHRLRSSGTIRFLALADILIEIRRAKPEDYAQTIAACAAYASALPDGKDRMLIGAGAHWLYAKAYGTPPRRNKRKK